MISTLCPLVFWGPDVEAKQPMAREGSGWHHVEQ